MTARTPRHLGGRLDLRVVPDCGRVHDVERRLQRPSESIKCRTLIGASRRSEPHLPVRDSSAENHR